MDQIKATFELIDIIYGSFDESEEVLAAKLILFHAKWGPITANIAVDLFEEVTKLVYSPAHYHEYAGEETHGKVSEEREG